MAEKSSNNGGAVQSFMVGAIVGGAVGAAFALLYAPKKGKELRDEITSKVGDIPSRISALLKSAKEAGEDLVSEAADTGDELVKEAYKKAESLIDEADRIISDARERVKAG